MLGYVNLYNSVVGSIINTGAVIRPGGYHYLGNVSISGNLQQSGNGSIEFEFSNNTNDLLIYTKASGTYTTQIHSL